MATTSDLELLRVAGSEAALRASVLAPYEAIATAPRVHVFGAQRLGERLATALQAAGRTVVSLLDNDPRRQGKTLAGLPIVAPQAAEPGLPVVVASANYLTAIVRQVRGSGALAVPYPALSLLDSAAFPPDLHFQGMWRDLAAHGDRYAEAHARLEDAESRRVFDALLRFRLSLDVEALPGAAPGEYFGCEALPLGPDEVYVDGGAYDGDTALAFLDRVGGRYRRIHLFEPDSDLLARAAIRLAGRPDVVLHPEGLYDRTGEVRFSLTGGLDGAIGEAGQAVIPVTTIDQAVPEAVSLIKLDVEGAEAEALEGARRQLREAAPKLAIAAYHRAEDLWKLPALIAAINPRYRFYLRHHGPTFYDTVLYAEA